MYYFIYALLWLVSLLPFRILYIISDGLYGIAFYVIKYRRNVVMNNLLIAFPEKTNHERLLIAKKFYHNLIDMFIETIKMLSMSDRTFQKRFTGNWHVINDIYTSGKTVQAHAGHNFNWEWGNVALAANTPFKLLGVYMPISNKIFERLYFSLRTRKGTIFLRATHMKEDFLPHKNTQYILGLVADQNPGDPANAWWFNFMNKPAPFIKGPAKAAIENDTEVIFARIHKSRRGYYEAVFSKVDEHPASLTQVELTRKFVHYLQSSIQQYPDMWLWSHRRWKYNWKEEFGPIN